MSIRLPDPFLIEGAPGFLSAPLVDNYPILQDPLTDGTVLQVKNGYQYWSFSITYPDLTPEEYGIVISSIEEAKRLGDFITVLLPQFIHYRVTGSVSGLTIAAGQKGTTINIAGINSAQGRPMPGDLIQMTGDSKKVYRITSVDTSTSDEWTLGIYPDLVITTTGDEKPVFNNILFQTKLSAWSTTTNVSTDGLYTGVSFNFREAK